MIEPGQFVGALRSAKIGWTVFAKMIERNERDIRNWMDGTSPIPPYILLTIKAVQYRLLPADNRRMGFDDVAAILGIERQRVEYWRKTGDAYPLTARFAVTAHDYIDEQKQPNIAGPERLDHNQFRVLSLIVRAGKYWRVSGGWRARPQLGERFPRLQLATPEKLLQRGLIEHRYDRAQGYVIATKAGQKLFYDHHKGKQA